MKKNLARIWGVGLVVIMLASLLISALPVSAAELSWGTYGLPGSANSVLVTNVDIKDIAVASDGTTVYVAGGGTAYYKSTNGGKTFSASTPSVTPAFTNINLVAVSPDDANVVVLAGNANNLAVAVSTNGGSSWSSLGTVTSVAGAAVATNLFDLTISPLSAGARFVALAGNSAAGPGIYYLGIGATVPGWKNAVLDFTTPLVVGTIANFKAVAFSPSFVSDQTAVAVSADPTAVTGGMQLHILSFNQQKWNAVAGFTGYPVMVKLTVGAFALTSAAIALDPNYLGGDDSLRNVFIAADALDGASQVGGIYRVKDTSVANLLATTAMYSIAYNGSVLVSGSTASNSIRRSEDPMATSPSVGSTSGLKRPGLDAGANPSIQGVVAFAGTNVVAGVSATAPGAGDGTGFGISTDLGKSFNEYALVDSVVNAALSPVQPQIVGMAFAADGSKVYMLTNNGAGTVTSLWRYTDAWARIWQFATAPTTQYLIRVSPDNKDVVYITDQGGTNMWYTDNGGEVRWFPRSSRYNVQDMVVESADIAYVAVSAAGTVSKTTNKGFTWGDAKSASLAGGNTFSIKSLGTDKLIVGSTAGAVSYSADGNANWTKIDKILTGAGNTVATASGLANGDFIYAAQSVGATKVERWTIGTSTSWKDTAAPVPVNTATETYGATGIALSEGALFVLINDNLGAALDSRILRTISPSADAPGWSSSTLAVGADTDLSPNALYVTKGSTTLYAVDTTPATPEVDVVYTFLDTLTTAKAALGSPADAGAVKVNPISGNVYSVSFSWTRPHGATGVATGYDLRIAENADFNLGVQSVTVAATTDGTVSSSPALNLNPGQKYYWRVRVTAGTPVQSNWSDTRSFTIEEAKVTPPVTITPAPPAPIITLPAPVINLPPPTTITIPPAPVITIPPPPAPPAPIAPAYIWAVVIIGAVLVIAVIILIVRTRRPV